MLLGCKLSIGWKQHFHSCLFIYLMISKENVPSKPAEGDREKTEM